MSLSASILSDARQAVKKARRVSFSCLNSILHSLPNASTEPNLARGLFDFSTLEPTTIYRGGSLPRLESKTLEEENGPRIRLSAEPRALKGGAIVAMREGFLTEEGVAFAADGRLLYSNDTSEFQKADLLARPPTWLRGATRVPGPVALISGNGFNYFHWLFEALPRLHLLNQAGHKDCRLYGSVTHPVQQDTFDLIGIDRTSIIQSSDLPIVRADTILLPHFLGRGGNCFSRIEPDGTCFIGNLEGHLALASWICDFLRDLSSRVPGTTSTPRRIYISRRDSHKGRAVLNEEDISTLLADHGFTTVSLTGKSFAEQVQLFRNAEFVIGAHGAALANLVFCRPETKCVELMGDAYVSDLYAALCQLVGVDYHYLISATGTRPNGAKRNTSFAVDVERLLKLLKIARN